jgi:acyl-CoA thioesterase
MPASASSPDVHAQSIASRLLSRDSFSQWLGLELGEVAFAAAESAFALACNSHGRQSVGITATMDFLKAGRLGDVLSVEAREESLKEKVSVYQLRIVNQTGTLLAMFKGTAYRTRHEIM